MSTRRSRLAGWIAAWVLVVAASACGGDDAHDTPESSSTKKSSESTDATKTDESSTSTQETTTTEGEHAGHNDEGETTQAGTIDGLRSTADGYRLALARTRLPAAEGAEFSFRILDRDGDAVKRFGIDQTKKMHLVVVRRDLSSYQHVHPRMESNGTWITRLNVASGGRYRAFADFAAGGKRHVLGATLTTGGADRSRPLPPPSKRATVGGFVVTLPSPTLTSQRAVPVRFRVTREGQSVTDLQPYLGALGHLVLIRVSNLQYLHVHPNDLGDARGPRIRFTATLPESGPYRAFLQFKRAGRVYTAAYTLIARA